MTGIIDSNPTLSNITLALMEDSGLVQLPLCINVS